MEVEAPPRQPSSPSSSPEFEFWMVRNPSFTPSNLLSADELFLDGVLLPLQLLSLHRSSDPSVQQPLQPDSPSPSSILSSSPPSTSFSKRWKDLLLFKAPPEKKTGEKDQRKKDRRKSSAEYGMALNIWPFTRSQSAGSRPRTAGSVSFRKVSSAPCSRSNSRGESGPGRRGPLSPGRAGLHLGRSGPVWQIRRAGVGPKEKGKLWNHAVGKGGGGSGAGGVRVLNLNVNSCIGYGERPNSWGNDTACDRIAEGNGGNAAGSFSLRALFSRKVY